ncbi:ATP-dependent metallopeptidase FtsH/Yme1/Tma family protein, partial [Tessaracoccus sp. OH4464_COT-324]
MVKNLVLWIVVAVVMMTAYQSFSGSSSSNAIDYTTFISDVENNQVSATKFNEVGEIFVTKKD